jgi:hypothetical protein
MKDELKLSVEKNFVEIAKCLLSHLTRAKELIEFELSKLLDIAAENDYTKIAHELLINGANVNPQKGTLIKFSPR